MNFFSGWLLSPNLKVETQPESSFVQNLGKEGGVSVLVMSETDLSTNSAHLQFPIAFCGQLKTKVLYPLNVGGTGYFFIVPKDEPKKLSFEQPGKAHIASHIGALLSPQLVSLSNKLENQAHFFVTFSEDIEFKIDGEQQEFIIGLLQKTITNKVYKKSQQSSNEKFCHIILQEPFFSKEIIFRAQAVSDAMCYTRTFINMPPNILNPETYEIFLRSIVKHECEKASQPNYIQIDILNYEKLLQEGCGLICAVGQGSTVKPRIVKLTYTPKRGGDKIPHISLVGKGITFDSGGYDIKPSSGMRIMKKDMGGSAAALGIFFACARLGLQVRLTCWLALAENMISGNAMRPGDIYKARNGFNVEIDNTDAEGRLVLADTISLACEEFPDWLIDFATLTGAARVSLGTMVDSLFGNDKATTQLLYHSGIETGDWVWNIPMPLDYEAYFDSNASDFMNSSPAPFAGAVTAALFLQKFVSLSKWNHVDTYMWCDKPTGLWAEGNGATGKCVRLVTRAINAFISKREEVT